MALTCKLYGRYLGYVLSPFMFHTGTRDEYLASLRNDSRQEPPIIMIEVYFREDAELSELRGNNNSKGEDTCGISLRIEFDTEFSDEYARYIEEPTLVQTIPVGYYKVSWFDFANRRVTKRSLPFTSTFIDASNLKLQSGADYYISNMIDNSLTPRERAQLSLDYRTLKEEFKEKPYLGRINKAVTEDSPFFEDSNLSVSLDVSGKSNWESHMMMYLDELPVSNIGQGN